MRVGRRKGFTMIELLVTITIIAILAAVAVPSVMSILDKTNTESDEVLFKDVYKVINNQLLQMNTSGRVATADEVLKDVYAHYSGSYTSKTVYDKGDMRLPLFKEADRSGACVTVELFRMMNGKTYVKSGFIIRQYESSSASATGNVLAKDKEGKDLKRIVDVPGMHFTVQNNGAVVIDTNGNYVAQAGA